MSLIFCWCLFSQIEGELEKDSLAKATYQVRPEKHWRGFWPKKTFPRTCTPSVRSARSCSTTTSRSSTPATLRPRTPSTGALSTKWRWQSEKKYFNFLTYFPGHGVEGRTCPAPLAWDGEGDSLWHCSGPDQGIDLLRFSPKMHLWLDLKKQTKDQTQEKS